MSQRRPARTHGRDRRPATSYGPAWLRLGESGGDSPTQGKGGFAGNWQALHSTGADSCDEMVSGLQHAAAARERMADNW